MKKSFLVLFLVFTSYFSFSQLLSGNVLDSGRKMLTTYDFKIKGKYKGVKYFELSVNLEGKVTGVREEVKADSFVSSPAKLIARKELEKLQFEAGTRYDKFQQVLVKVEFVKDK